MFRRVNRDHPRIVRSSGVWGGKAVVAGTRVPVFMVYARLASGWTEAEVLESYPRLTHEDISAVLAYARDCPDAVEADREAYERSLPSAEC